VVAHAVHWCIGAQRSLETVYHQREFSCCCLLLVCVLSSLYTTDTAHTTLQFMVTVARIPRYTDRLDCTVFISKFAEYADTTGSVIALQQSALDQVICLLHTLAACTVLTCSLHYLVVVCSNMSVLLCNCTLYSHELPHMNVRFCRSRAAVSSFVH
jgi:hypothetical protein